MHVLRFPFTSNLHHQEEKEKNLGFVLFKNEVCHFIYNSKK